MTAKTALRPSRKSADSKPTKSPSKSSKKGKISSHMGKPVTVSKLKKKLRSLFSLYVRKRDGYKCVTCGKAGEGSQIHGGHFITGATCGTELYFDETNVHAQCYHCNINLSGNWVRYEDFMLRQYGLKHVEDLKKRRTLEMGRKVGTEWYEDRIVHYSGILIN